MKVGQQVSGNITRRRLIGGALVTVAAIQTAPLLASSSATAAPLNGQIGYRSNDLDPRVGALTSFGSTTGFALDCLYRSIGTDLGPTWASDNSVTPGTGHVAVEVKTTELSHRLNERDLSLYVSDDNSHWSRVSASFLNLGTTVWLHSFYTEARYIKVSCTRENQGTESTFKNTNLQSMMTVHWLPVGTFIGGSGNWPYSTPVTVSNPGTAEIKDRAVYITENQLAISSMISSGHLRSDMADLRFADSSGRMLHTYHDGDGFFVRIPTIGPNSSTTIFAWSGRPDAVSALNDSGALQVEYGRRTFQRHAVTSASGLNFASQVHAVRLPNSSIALVAASSAAGGLHARYSTDQGRTWAVPVPFLAATDGAAVRKDYPGGFLVDPVSGTLVCVLNSIGAASGSDWTNPAQFNGQIWSARAQTFDSNGRPEFGSPQRINLTNPFTGQPVAYALTYSNPIKTATGTYLAPVSYMYSPRGGMAVDVLRSTDQGVSWSQSSTPLYLPAANIRTDGLSECNIVQLDNGTVKLLARNQLWGHYYFAESLSTDDGVTWSPPEESSILASNTMASMKTDSSGEQVLVWSGHNALGQQSFWRSSLTLAGTLDESTFVGYHDLTGATLFSDPGWSSANARIGMIEALGTEISADDLLIAWANYAQRGGTILVENYREYIYDSHCALDILHHEDPAFAPRGAELASARWLRSSESGSLELAVDSSRPGKVLRITSGASSAGIGASRIFPAMRRGRIRFKVKLNSISDRVEFAVQEAMSRDNDLGIFGSNSRGTVAVLRILSSGQLLSSSDDAFGVTPVAGFAEADLSPGSTPIGIGNLLYSDSPIALDYNTRSIGLDLGVSRPVTGLLLRGDATVSGSSTTRLDPSNVTIWASDTNTNDWTIVSGWSGTKSGLELSFTGPSINKRYVKVTHPFSDTGWTFANLIQEIISVTPDRPDLVSPSIYTPTNTPTVIAPQQWTTVELDFDIPGNSVRILVNGSLVHTAPVKHPADVVTHFFVSGVGDVDIRMSEFMAQDLERGLPEVDSVGTLVRARRMPPRRGR